MSAYEKSPKNTLTGSENLSPDAPAFIPGAGASCEGKKLKKVRTGPRKRRRKKNEGEFLDFDTSDLLERTSQGSNTSSTPGVHRRGRERAEKGYVPLYHCGLSPQESTKFADLTNMNLSNMNGNNVPGDWLTGIMGGSGPARYRSGSTNSDVTNRSSEWLDMQAEWSLSKQLFGSLRLNGGGVLGAVAGSGSGSAAPVSVSAGAPGNERMLTGHGIAINSNPPNNTSAISGVNGGVSVAQEEARERKRWSEWAISAAEMERYRRIVALEEIDRAEARERLRRRRWAINAIEAEKNERLSANFLTNLTSTNWFHETISSLPNKDYDVVCPYYKLGCRVTCKKSDIERHVKTCSFGVESSHNSNSEVLVEDYEVVCPNSVLGCKYIGGKNDLQLHLGDGCAFKGKSKQEEHEERALMRQFVISECEEERGRRLAEDKNSIGKKAKRFQRSASASRVESGTREEVSEDFVNSSKHKSSVENVSSISEVVSEDEDKGDDKTLTLHLLMEIQMNKVVTGLHNEALQFWEHFRENQNQRRPMEINLIKNLQLCLRQFWDFATLEPFGSWATGLPAGRSDIDLVVCFEDDILLTKTPTSRIDLLRQLASYLGEHAKDLMTITKVLLHTRVPQIKATAVLSIPCNSTEGGMRLLSVQLDISIDGPEHSGLATTSLSQSILKALPGLGPATMIIKEYLKEKGLCDSYSGGLASYGIFLLVALLFLRRFHANQLAVESKPVSAIDAKQPQFHKDGEIPIVPDANANVLFGSLSAPRTNTNLKAKLPSKNSNTPRRTLDKSFSTEFHVDSPTQSPSHPARNMTQTPSKLKSVEEGPINGFPALDEVELTRSSSGGSDPSPYSFINVKHQKEYGRRVAAKLLLNPEDVDDQEQTLLEIEAFLSASVPLDLNDLSSSALDSLHPLKAPMLGVILVEFLGVYGEELQCGRHGFSVRDGGFRFDVQPGLYTVAHPQANDPLLIEDPVNVMNNVAKYCFNALAVQRAFLEAHDKFKNVVTRYSGRAGSALATKSGSIIDEMFGISLSRAPGYPVNYADIVGGEPPRGDPGTGAPEGPGVLLYRRTVHPSRGVIVPGVSDMTCTFPKQLLDDIVRSKKSSAGVILGEEFRKVLHEMLLHQQMEVSSSTADGQLTVRSSPDRGSHKIFNKSIRGKSGNGTTSSPRSGQKKSSDSVPHTPPLPLPLPKEDGVPKLIKNNMSSSSAAGLRRPPPKKRLSHTSTRKSPSVSDSLPHGHSKARSESI